MAIQIINNNSFHGILPRLIDGVARRIESLVRRMVLDYPQVIRPASIMPFMMGIVVTSCLFTCFVISKIAFQVVFQRKIPHYSNGILLLIYLTVWLLSANTGFRLHKNPIHCDTPFFRQLFRNMTQDELEEISSFTGEAYLKVREMVVERMILSSRPLTPDNTPHFLYPHLRELEEMRLHPNTVQIKQIAWNCRCERPIFQALESLY